MDLDADMGLIEVNVVSLGVFMSKRMLAGVFALLFLSVWAEAATHQYLIRFTSADPAELRNFTNRNGGTLELVSQAGNLYKWTSEQTFDFTWDSNVRYV